MTLTASNRPQKVLVVDDDPDSRALLKLGLQNESLEVLEADDGQACMTIALSMPVDIILLDVMMPNMDGFRCCEMLHHVLRDRCPPIFLVTALNDECSVEKAYEIEADDYIIKPVNIPLLRHRIDRALGERKRLKALETANRELHIRSRTDSLTQLANRGYFEEVLSREWGRLARRRELLGILICDLDFFKQYNDRYGHPMGDRCLQTFARVLKSAVKRSADFVARYGGEEFIVLLPNTDLSGMQQLSSQILHLLADQAISHEDSSIAKVVTCSIGGAVAIPDPSYSPGELVAAADEALYRAKSSGRNRLVLMEHRFTDDHSVRD